MKNDDVSKAIIYGLPGISFEFSTDNPEEEATDLDGLDWPSDSPEPKPDLATVVGWDTARRAEETATINEQISNRSDFVDQYQAAITRLDAIITNGPTYTAAQVRDAVVDLARIQRRLLKFIKSELM